MPKCQSQKMNKLAILIYLAALVSGLDAAAMGKCTLSIRRSTILESWQSSYFEDFCFNNRSEDGKNSWHFFHSGERKDFAVDGFHWFLISLKQTQMLRSVTIKSRGDPNHEVHFRAADIEIWSSMEDLSDQLGSDHCNSNNISSIFVENSWKYCCKTKSNIILGEYFDTKCNCQAKLLLLRKYVDNLTNWEHQCMNFENLWLNPIDRPSSLDNYKITTENGICNAKSPNAEVKVIFESPDVPTHECSAFDSHGKQMNVTEVKGSTCDIAGNVLKSEWLCHDCNSFLNVTVRCRADSHETTKLLQETCPRSHKPLVLVILVISSIVLIITISMLTAVSLISIKMRRRSSQLQRRPVARHSKAAPPLHSVYVDGMNFFYCQQSLTVETM